MASRLIRRGAARVKRGGEKSRSGRWPSLSSLPVPTTTGIRLAEEKDAAAIAAIYAPNITEGVASFELVPPDAQEMARRMAGILPAYPWLVCEHGGRVAGYVYASQHMARAAYQWSANVSAYIDAGFHRRGIGRALYTSLFALLRLQGFYNAYGGITLPNAGSVGCTKRWASSWWAFTGHRLQAGPLARRGLVAAGVAAEAHLRTGCAAGYCHARRLPEWQAAMEAGVALLR